MMTEYQILEIFQKKYKGDYFSIGFDNNKLILFSSNPWKVWWNGGDEDFWNLVKESQKIIKFEVEFCHPVTQMVKKTTNKSIISLNDKKQDDNKFEILDDDGNVKYIVTRESGIYSCTCLGYSYRRRCKHVEKIKNENKI